MQDPLAVELGHDDREAIGAEGGMEGIAGTSEPPACVL